ncbi:MAG: DUF937 domain-containing protein [Erysipelotrichaceae bacterium]|nr:DUF937 domain-containing protein [Erysipelotrichaceae bacterium]
MNLLQLLLGLLLSKKAVNNVSQQTGASSGLTSKLLMIAIPLLIRYMTQNASSQSGAQSLLGALTQHNSNRSVESQLQEADTEDGKKIIGHILGNDQDKVVNDLSKETGMDTAQVIQTLSTIAPALLSGLSAATQQSNQQNDLAGLLNTFGGQQQTSSNSALDALAGMFGKKPQQESTLDGSDLLSALTSLMK